MKTLRNMGLFALLLSASASISAADGEQGLGIKIAAVRAEIQQSNLSQQRKQQLLQRLAFAEQEHSDEGYFSVFRDFMSTKIQMAGMN